MENITWSELGKQNKLAKKVCQLEGKKKEEKNE